MNPARGSRYATGIEIVAGPAMTPQAPLPPFDLVIFGGTGDLALRKLLPALFHRFVEGQIPAGTRVLGIARDVIGDDEWRERARAALERAVITPDEMCLPSTSSAPRAMPTAALPAATMRTRGSRAS